MYERVTTIICRELFNWPLKIIKGELSKFFHAQLAFFVQIQQ